MVWLLSSLLSKSGIGHVSLVIVDCGLSRDSLASWFKFSGFFSGGSAEIVVLH